MNRKYFLPVFLLFQIIFLNILGFFPEAIEKYYSNGIYVWISKFSRTVFGWIPFSIGDVIYLILISLLLKYIFKNRKHVFSKSAWKLYWKSFLLKVLSCVSVFYFLLNLLWGLNYHRLPLFEKMDLDKEYSQQDLEVFTQKMIDKTNEIHLKIVSDKEKIVRNTYSAEAIYQKSLLGYKNLSNKHPYFHYEKPSVKNSLVSLPLTYMGFGGYLNPFTNEAQVNYKIPKYNYPTTSTHEMAHQLGYASESEANFIGYLASVNSDDIYFQFSGYSYALKYCLANLERFEEGRSEEFLPLINAGILKNFQETKDFWADYETPIDTFFHFFYDKFLKANQQKDGLESYNKFVGLMIGYYKNLPTLRQNTTILDKV